MSGLFPSIFSADYWLRSCSNCDSRKFEKGTSGKYHCTKCGKIDDESNDFYFVTKKDL